MFFTENDTKSFMKPEYSVTQSSAMSFDHPYKWSTADVLSRKNIFSTTLVIKISKGCTGFHLM